MTDWNVDRCLSRAPWYTCVLHCKLEKYVIRKFSPFILLTLCRCRVVSHWPCREDNKREHHRTQKHRWHYNGPYHSLLNGVRSKSKQNGRSVKLSLPRFSLVKKNSLERFSRPKGTFLAVWGLFPHKNKNSPRNQKFPHGGLKISMEWRNSSEINIDLPFCFWLRQYTPRVWSITTDNYLLLRVSLFIYLRCVCLCIACLIPHAAILKSTFVVTSSSLSSSSSSSSLCL